MQLISVKVRFGELASQKVVCAVAFHATKWKGEWSCLPRPYLAELDWSWCSWNSSQVSHPRQQQKQQPLASILSLDVLFSNLILSLSLSLSLSLIVVAHLLIFLCLWSKTCCTFLLGNSFQTTETLNLLHISCLSPYTGALSQNFTMLRKGTIVWFEWFNIGYCKYFDIIVWCE